MRSIFNKVQDAALGKLILSNVYTFSDNRSGVPVTISSGTTLLKNGAAVSGTSTTISTGDTLQLQVVSSASYATTVFGLVLIDGEAALFAVTSSQDPSKYQYAAFADLTPLELTKYQSGQDYIPNADDNALSIYNADGSFVKSIPAKAPSTPTATANDLIVLANYYGNDILKVDSVTQQVVQSVVVGSRPYGIAHTPTSDTNADSLTWVSISAENKVVVLDKNNNLVDTHYTGERPFGIAVTQDGKHLFVANNKSNTVTHFQLNGAVWSSTDVAVGEKPFEIATDLRGNAWVTCTGTDKVYRITRDNVVTPFTVGNGPRGVLIDGSGNVWVACAKDNAVAKLNPTNAVLTSTTTHQVPFALALGNDGSIYVSNFGDSTVQRLSPAGALLATISVGKYPYGLAVHANGQLWVADLYSNTPEYLYAYDQTPLGFGIQDQVTVRPNTLIVTNTITVAEVNVSTPVAVPNLYGAVILKNGVESGTATSVVNGDTIAFKFTTPNVYNVSIDMPIFIGSQSESFTATVPPEDRIVDIFSFTDQRGDPSTLYTSNTITVSGIDSTAVLPISTTEGTLVINGTDTGSTSGTVKLNDTVAVRAQTSGVNQTTKFITVSINGVSATWRLTAYVVDTNTYLKPAYKTAEMYDPSMTGVSTNLGWLTRIALADYSAQSWQLAPGAPTPDTIWNRFIPRPAEGDVVRFDSNQAMSEMLSLTDTSGVNVEPKHIAAGRFVSCDANSSIYDIKTKTFIDVGPARPRQAALSGTTLYVGMSDGTIITLVPNAVSGLYEKDRVISVADCTDIQAVTSDTTGGVYNGLVYAFDIGTNHLLCLNGTAVISNSPNLGRDVWAIAAGRNYIWLANSYDNTVSKINPVDMTLVQTIAVGSVPNRLTVDKNGNIWVAHYGSPEIFVLDGVTGAKLSHIQLSHAPAMQLEADGDYVWVSELYPNIVAAQNKTSALLGLGITFAEKLNASRNATVHSDAVTITTLIRPISISLQPSAGQRLFVNGVQTSSAVVDNGDVLAIEIDTGSGYYVDSTAYITTAQDTVAFHVQTEADIFPDSESFTPQFDVYVRQQVQSDAITISGLSPNTSTLVEALDEDWAIVLNGVNQTAGAIVSVKNGDAVAIKGPAHGQYGGTVQYKLILAQADTFAPEYLVASLSVTNKTLDGPVPAPGHIEYSVPTAWTDQPRGFQSTDGMSATRRQPADSTYAFAAPGAVKAETTSRTSDPLVAEQHALQSSYSSDAEIVFEKQLYRVQPDVSTGISFETGLTRRLTLVDEKASDDTLLPTKFYTSNFLEVDPAYEPRGFLRVLNEVTPSYEKRESHDRLGVDPSYESRGSRDFVAGDPQYEARGSRSFVANDPQYENRGNREAKLAPISEYVHLDLPKGHGAESEVKQFDYVARRLTHFSDNWPKTYNVYTLLIGPEVGYVTSSHRRLAITDEPMAYGILKSSIHSVGVPGFDTRPHTAFLLAELETSFTVMRGSFALMPAREAFSRYVVHDYTVGEDAATEGAYATATEAIAAGIAAGFPKAYAVPLPRGHFMWATPIDRGAVNTPKYPIPEKWYVQGG